MNSSNNKGKIPKLMNKNSDNEDSIIELRRGPWTLEEDNLLIKYITSHGEGRWNALAKIAGLKRTGKSCRLRWLNYLKPDIKRGNLSPHEQILILELHSKWGNRWSKIAQHLPGRTDNEIKNYWRTRVQKQARQLKVDSNSKKFLDTIRMFWMPRLIEKMEQNSSEISSLSSSSSIFENSQTLITSHDDSSTVLIDRVVSKSSSSLPNECNNNNSSVKFEEHDRQIPGNEINNPLKIVEKECDKFFCEKAIDHEADDCYHVGFPCYNDVQELECSPMDINGSLSGHRVDEYDWPREDLSSTFWNTDELWLGVI